MPYESTNNPNTGLVWTNFKEVDINDDCILIGTTSKRVYVKENVNVILDDATMNKGMYCLGDSIIMLYGDNRVVCDGTYPGIKIGSNGTTLTIDGDGSLYAYGSIGIGSDEFGGIGDNVRYGGSIVIKNGTIEAYGENYPGIGTSTKMQDISIQGGSILAVGNNTVGIGVGVSTVEDGGVGTFQGGVIEVNAGVTLVFCTWSVHDHLEVGGFTSDIVGSRTGDGRTFVGNFDATVVVLDGGCGASKFQEYLRTVQCSRILVVILVIAGFITWILVGRISWDGAAGTVKFIARNLVAGT